MNYSDDSFATMLLTMALTPNRAEYARPLSTQEYRRISQLVQASSVGRLGGLLQMDISGLMQLLRLPEEEAYRVFTLLNRGVQLSYALEGFLRRGIEAVSLFDREYPERLKRRMGNLAPPILFLSGDRALLEMPMIGVFGISGVKTTQEVRSSVEALVRGAKERGYAILTGGELGVSRVAAGLAREMDVPRIDALGGGMDEHIAQEENALRIAEGRAIAISLEHPEALFTVSHAILRNKFSFAMAEAAFIFNTDLKRGETDAIKNRLCDWIYAYIGWPQNQALISRGATAIGEISDRVFAELSVRWHDSRTEQVSMFDFLQEK